MIKDAQEHTFRADDVADVQHILDAGKGGLAQRALVKIELDGAGLVVQARKGQLAEHTAHVVWAAERQRFECPCHHAAFEARSGRVLFGPPRRGLSAATIKAV